MRAWRDDDAVPSWRSCSGRGRFAGRDSWASSTNAPGPTRPQTNGMFERFTAPWPTPCTTTPKQPVAKHSNRGCTSTITNEPTAPSGSL